MGDGGGGTVERDLRPAGWRGRAMAATIFFAAACQLSAMAMTTVKTELHVPIARLRAPYSPPTRSLLSCPSHRWASQTLSLYCFANHVVHHRSLECGPPSLLHCRVMAGLVPSILVVHASTREMVPKTISSPSLFALPPTRTPCSTYSLGAPLSPQPSSTLSTGSAPRQLCLQVVPPRTKPRSLAHRGMGLCG